jgi:hypothetical protein
MTPGEDTWGLVEIENVQPVGVSSVVLIPRLGLVCKSYERSYTRRNFGRESDNVTSVMRENMDAMHTRAVN